MKSNFHTHSTYCDGNQTLEENIKIAIQKDFDVLGFSSHAELPFSDDWHIKVEQFDDYCSEINSLKEKYENEIKIRLGFEADFINGITTPSLSTYKKYNPDYIIGSVHYVYNGKGIFEADGSPESIQQAINDFYNGDKKSAVIRYFEQEREMIEAASKNGIFTIIGHADLIRKTNISSNLLSLGFDFFDENDTWYKEQIKLTADSISKAGLIAEINTGAISRKRMKTPYPSQEFLSLLKERNVPITINSDSHNAENLDCAFDMAVEYAKKVGYTESVVDLTACTPLFQKF